MSIELATQSDLDALCDFYQAVCAQQEQDEYTPLWNWGDYPSRKMLADAIDQRDVVMNLRDGVVASAGILSVGEDPEYADVPWQHQFKDDEIAVLHLFAVDKRFRGQGLAKETLQAIKERARKNGAKVIHLDIIDPNVPAEKAYLKAGFRFNNAQIINYDDLGPTPGKLFEYLL